MTTQPRTEIARTSYVGTSLGYHNSYTWVIGPVLVDVVIYSHGVDYRDTYSVVIDGWQQFVGPADEIRPNGLPDIVGGMMILHPADDAYNDGWNDYFTFAAGGSYRSAENLRAESATYRHMYGKGWAAAHRAADRWQS